MLNKLGLYYRTLKHLKPIQVRYRLRYMVRDAFRSVVGPPPVIQRPHRRPLPYGDPMPGDVPAGQGPQGGSRGGSARGAPANRGEAGAPVTAEEEHRTGEPASDADIPPVPAVSSAGRRGGPLDLAPGLDAPKSLEGRTFTFLNRSFTFGDHVDWNYREYGLLWAYNLNYFDCLRQPGMTVRRGVALIREFLDRIEENRVGLKSYPISLRGINWIKFLSRHNIEDREIDQGLYAQYRELARYPEYHIMGNHILENGCSLLFGALYFRDSGLLEQALEILEPQLDEQVLEDGAHFERSTMYHAIILERLLDCYNLLSRNRGVIGHLGHLEEKLRQVCARMLGWNEALAMPGGQLPLLNDAAQPPAGGSHTPAELSAYAGRLGLEATPVTLGESGYRRLKEGPLDLVADAGEIGPDYIPGHAHSDTLSFVLWHGERPHIIDPGISTYENNEIRRRERSTAFHNTVMVGGTEQSEVWSAFRVGRRARITARRQETVNEVSRLTASHDGYRRLGVVHRRTWEMGPGGLTVTDLLASDEGGGGDREARAFLHFSPALRPELDPAAETIRAGSLEISFENADKVALQNYSCPDGYNQYLQAVKAEITFNRRLVTRIVPTP